VTFLISHKSVGVDGEGGCRSKGIPPPPRHLPCPLTTILSLSATLSFLSSGAKPRDLQFRGPLLEMFF
jgi:hypothetical protein